MWTTIIFIFLMIVLSCIFSRRLPNYPPGPIQLPVVGNLLSAWWELRKLKYHHKVWQMWSKKYGPVLGLRMGYENVVVISGREMIKEVASRDVFDGRPNGFFYTMRSFDKKIGLVFSDGPYWNKIRREILCGLKNFGYGGSIMEKHINEECRALIDLRMADGGKPVHANHMFDICVANILWRLIAGKRYDLEDERLKYMCYIITRIFRVVDMSGGIVNFMPFLRHVIPGVIGYTELMMLHNTLHKFVKETIDEHRPTLDINKPRDLIDTFLIEMTQNKELYTEEELQVVCVDFLEAGVETVSNTAGYLMLYFARDLKLQYRIQKEIDAEIGNSRAPSLSDRLRMVYTEAVLLEALRITSVAPVGIPHMALDDARLGDYVIPKRAAILNTCRMLRKFLQLEHRVQVGTTILLALYDQHNGEHWKDPATFRPERFLSEDGNLIQDDRMLPFGSGRRRCIGEKLARNELFLFVTNILQNFILHLPEGDPIPSTDPVNGVTLSAQDFKVIFEPRNGITH